MREEFFPFTFRLFSSLQITCVLFSELRIIGARHKKADTRERVYHAPCLPSFGFGITPP